MVEGPKAIREVADLQSHALLCEDDGAEWTRWLLSMAGVQQAWRLVPMGNAHVAIEAALHGQGVALADTLLDQVDLEQGRLVRLFDKGIAAQHAYYLVHRQAVADTPAGAAFIGWLQHRLRRTD